MSAASLAGACPAIIQALETSGAPMINRRVVVGNANELAERCEIAFNQFDAAFDKLQALPTVTARRAASIKLFPVLDDAVKAMRARDTANGLDEDHVSLRSDRVFGLMLTGLEGPCAWPKDEVWINLVPGEDA